MKIIISNYLTLAGSDEQVSKVLNEIHKKWKLPRGEEHVVSSSCITFNTEWQSPFPVIQSLSKRYPDVIFDVVYLEDNPGCCCGEYTFMDGEMILWNIPKYGSDEAWEIYFSVHEDERDEWHKNENGDWVYVDWEEEDEEEEEGESEYNYAHMD